MKKAKEPKTPVVDAPPPEKVKVKAKKGKPRERHELRLAATPLQNDFVRRYAECFNRTTKEVVAEALSEFMQKHATAFTKREESQAKLSALSLIHI